MGRQSLHLLHVLSFDTPGWQLVYIDFIMFMEYLIGRLYVIPITLMEFVKTHNVCNITIINYKTKSNSRLITLSNNKWPILPRHSIHTIFMQYVLELWKYVKEKINVYVVLIKYYFCSYLLARSFLEFFAKYTQELEDDIFPRMNGHVYR